MKYQIVAFNELTAQITLQVDGFPLFLVDLPIDENQNVPTGTELDSYLKGFIPTWHKERQDKLSKGISNTEDITKLVIPLPVIEPTIEELSLQAREERNILLAKSDWTQTNDAPLTEIHKEAWKTYRQELRDLPTKDGFPINVIWPASPEVNPR